MIRPKLQCTHSEIIIDVCHQKDQKIDPQRNIISEIRNAYGQTWTCTRNVRRQRAWTWKEFQGSGHQYRVPRNKFKGNHSTIIADRSEIQSSQSSERLVIYSKLKGLRPQASVLSHQKVLSYETKFDLSVHLSIHSVTALQQCSHPGISPYLPPPLQGFNPQTRRQVT